jgi:hypothetical protein
LTLEGSILGKGFWGDGYFEPFVSLQASTHAPHATHLLISIRVAKGVLDGPAPDAVKGSCDAARPAVAPMPNFKNFRRDMCLGMNPPHVEKTAGFSMAAGSVSAVSDAVHRNSTAPYVDIGPAAGFSGVEPGGDLRLQLKCPKSTAKMPRR